MSNFININVNELQQVKWLDKYLDGHNGFIAGGCFKHILNNEKVTDIDIFFMESKDLVYAHMSRFNEANGFKIIRNNSKVISLKEESTGMKIDLVKSVYGTPEEVLSKFDFTVTKMAYGSQCMSVSSEPFEDEPQEVSLREYNILCVDTFFFHLHMKRLVIDDQILFPTSTFERTLRYSKYGFYPCKETKAKLLERLHKSELPEELSQSMYDGID